jgi:hypothetical protein
MLITFTPVRLAFLMYSIDIFVVVREIGFSRKVHTGASNMSNVLTPTEDAYTIGGNMLGPTGEPLDLHDRRFLFADHFLENW